MLPLINKVLHFNAVGSLISGAVASVLQIEVWIRDPIS